MVKSMPSLIVGIACLLFAIFMAVSQKRYIGSAASAIIAIICIVNALRS